MAEFGTSPEDKFKLSLLSIEKRFVELEGAFGDLSQKVQNIKLPDTQDLEQRISDLEDLIYVEEAGIEELKGILEEKGETPATSEEVQKIIEPIVEKVKSEMNAELDKIKNAEPVDVGHIEELNKRIDDIKSDFEKRLEDLGKTQLPNADNEKINELRDELNKTKAELEAQLSEIFNNEAMNPELQKKTDEMQAKIIELEAKWNALHHFRAELDNLKNKIETLNPQVVKSLITEISDLRIETGRDIREIKQKVGNVPLFADVQFLSNRIKDLKMAVDSLLNMRVELDAKILNMERNLAEGNMGGEATVNLISEVEDTKKQLFEMQRKLSMFDSKLKEMSKAEMMEMDQTKISNEIKVLYSKINNIYADVERKAQSMKEFAPIDFENRISDLNSKISSIENQLNNLRPENVDDKIAEMNHNIERLQEQIGRAESSHMDESGYEIESKISEMENKLNTMQPSGIQEVHLNSKISQLEQKIQALSQRPREMRSPVLEDQMQQILEKLIILETRVNVLESHITEPRRTQPVILE